MQNLHVGLITHRSNKASQQVPVHRNFPFEDQIYFVGVHSDAIIINDTAQEFQFGCEEMELGPTKVQLFSLQDVEY